MPATKAITNNPFMTGLRRCIRCEDYKPTGDFPRLGRKVNKDGSPTLSSYCKRCNYERTSLPRKQRFKEIIREAKSVPCVDCGKQYPPSAMDFDHVRGEKLFTIGSQLGRNRTEQELLAEIAKCDVRCAVCHRIRHHEE